MHGHGRALIEWPTFALLVGCYLAWGLGTTVLATLWLPLAVLVTALSVTLFSSLQHEVLHGHPFRSRWWSEASVFPALTLVIPFQRFRDLHLAHHHDEVLTDPYDDPESNYLDPVVWVSLPRPVQAVLRFNNTLAGRILIGPVVSLAVFLRAEWRGAAKGDRTIPRAWALHAGGLVPVCGWMWAVAEMPLWALALAVYMGHSVLKIRTYLEHRAHERARGRSVVVEDRGLLAFLFLNNNFHALHHAKPQVSWYRLPAVYAQTRAEVLRRNEGYVYPSYGAVIRQYLFRGKDPVAHPFRTTSDGPHASHRHQHAPAGIAPAPGA